MKQGLQQLKQAISDAENILLSTHEHPDTDGVASLLAISLYLSSQKKNFSIHVPGEASKYLSFLSNFEKINEDADAKNKKFDLLIGFDYGDFKRLKLEEFDLSKCKIATLDHHKNEIKGDFTIIDTKRSSTSEIVYEFFNTNNIEITKEIGECIYSGILEDTVGFSEKNTNSKVFDICSEMLKLNINNAIIYKKILGLRSLNIAKLTGIGLSRIKRDEKTKSVYAYLKESDLKEYKVKWEDVDHIPCMLNYEEDENFAFFLKDKEDGTVRVSFRSNENKYDVSKLAEKFGGGGSKYKSAANIEGSMEEVLKKILKLA